MLRCEAGGDVWFYTGNGLWAVVDDGDCKVLTRALKSWGTEELSVENLRILELLTQVYIAHEGENVVLDLNELEVFQLSEKTVIPAFVLNHSPLTLLPATPAFYLVRRFGDSVEGLEWTQLTDRPVIRCSYNGRPVGLIALTYPVGTEGNVEAA